MRRRSEIFDLGIIFGLTLAGFNRLPMILIVVGGGALAAGPIARSYAKARTRPDIDSRHIERSIEIDGPSTPLQPIWWIAWWCSCMARRRGIRSTHSVSVRSLSLRCRLCLINTVIVGLFTPFVRSIALSLPDYFEDIMGRPPKADNDK